jgi:predicted dehydrogenase
VEKPVAASVAELERLKAVAAKNGVVCVPGHNYIHEPPLVRARAMVESGDLGKLTSVYVMYNIHHPEAICARFPGVIRQIMTHHAYVSLFLLGKDPANQPQRLSCFRSTIRDADDDTGTSPQENHAMVTMQTTGGCLIHLCASFAADDHSSDPWSFYVKLIGTISARYRITAIVIPQLCKDGYLPYERQ